VSLSLEFLERSAAETGFRVSSLEKVARLGELAADIGRHPFLGSVLILKGGTALNLCFGPPTRLSVDLDFNYVGQAVREKMLGDRPLIETALVELARKRQYRVQKSAEAFAGRKFYLNYRSVLGPEERVEIDLTFIFRVPIAGIESRAGASYRAHGRSGGAFPGQIAGPPRTGGGP
jgi:predicted nucleotidyltransferase component of viral defense system